MKTLLTGLIFFNVLASSYGQDLFAPEPFVCSFKCNNTVDFIKTKCDLRKTVIRSKPIEGINPYDEFDMMVKKLNSEGNLTIPLIFNFRECPSICNAASVTIDSIQFILYNPEFLSKMRRTFDELWATRCIIAHEIAHHYLDHTTLTPTKPDASVLRKRELRADYLSGYIIKRMGAKNVLTALAGLETIKEGYYPVSSMQETGSNYPLFRFRVQAVIDGFNNSDTTLTMSMFKDIQSVALREYQRMGRSIIMRNIDRDISHNDMKEAMDKIGEYLQKSGLEIDQGFLNEIQKQLKEQDGKVPGSMTLPISTDADKFRELRNQYEKLKNGTPAQKIEAEKILKTIRDQEIKLPTEVPASHPDLRKGIQLPSKLPPSLPGIPSSIPAHLPGTQQE